MNAFAHTVGHADTPVYRRRTPTLLVTFADHEASVRVLEKAGYVKEGRMKHSAIKGGKIRDQFLYAAYKKL